MSKFKNKYFAIFTIIFIALQVFTFGGFISSANAQEPEPDPPKCYAPNPDNDQAFIISSTCIDDGQSIGGVTGANDKCYLVAASSIGASIQEIDCEDPRIKAANVADPVFEDCKDADTIEENCIVKRLASVINAALYGVGVVVLGAIIVSGIQYMISQGNSQKTAAARDRIISSLIALVLYALMFAILQWLIPGGVFD